MGAHGPIKDLLTSKKDRTTEVPFAKTIIKIERIRRKIEVLRGKPKSPKFPEKLSDLEHQLRSAYSQLAADAASKVAKWKRGPIL